MRPVVQRGEDLPVGLVSDYAFGATLGDRRDKAIGVRDGRHVVHTRVGPAPSAANLSYALLGLNSPKAADEILKKAQSKTN